MVLNMRTNSLERKLLPQLIVPGIAERIGRAEAVLLSQIIYWSKKSKHLIGGRKWVYNSVDKWQKQISYYSYSTIKRALISLESRGLIISQKINAKRYNHTKWYALNETSLDIFLKSISQQDHKMSGKRTNRKGQNEPIEKVKMSQSITENNYTKNSSSSSSKKVVNTPQISPTEEEKNIFETMQTNPEDTNVTTPTTDVENIATQMVTAWNEVFRYSISPIKAYVSRTNASYLSYLLQKTFDNNIESWIGYAETVNSSKWLMGEKQSKNDFKAHFSWLITHSTVQKILSAEYGVGDRVLDAENVQNNTEKLKEQTTSKIVASITNLIAKKTNAREQKKEFHQYVTSSAYKSDGDRYSLGSILKHYPPLYDKNGDIFFVGDDKKQLYKNCFDTFILKKNIGLTPYEIRQKINKKLEAIDNDQEYWQVLREIQNRFKVGDHNAHIALLG
jgi:hypothetical protein